MVVLMKSRDLFLKCISLVKGNFQVNNLSVTIDKLSTRDYVQLLPCAFSCIPLLIIYIYMEYVVWLQLVFDLFDSVI